jgi:speckle-type POZ protein
MSFAGVSIVGNGKAVGHAVNVATARGYHLLVVSDYSHTKANTPNGTAIYSLDFMVGGHRWRIRYYPKGENSECANSISLFLDLVDGNVTEAIKVQYEFSFIEQLEKLDSA